jgi:hypothetical protein
LIESIRLLSILNHNAMASLFSRPHQQSAMPNSFSRMTPSGSLEDTSERNPISPPARVKRKVQVHDAHHTPPPGGVDLPILHLDFDSILNKNAFDDEDYLPPRLTLLPRHETTRGGTKRKRCPASSFDQDPPMPRNLFFGGAADQ